MEELIKRGADPAPLDRRGAAPLQIAAVWGHTEAARVAVHIA